MGGKKRSLKIYNFNVKKWEKKVGKTFNVGPKVREDGAENQENRQQTAGLRVNYGKISQ